MTPNPVPRAACQNTFHARVRRTAKAMLGEALVRQYFELAGWSVTPTGVETIVDHLSSVPKVKRGDLATLPDFLVSRIASPRGHLGPHQLGQAFYVEVKTLRDWARSPNNQDFSRYLRWGHVLMVWVSPQGLKGAWLSRPGSTGSGGRLRAEDFQPLARVGSISIGHCAQARCEDGLRAYFDGLAKALAEMRHEQTAEAAPGLSVA